jgi:hypothetical protein
MGGHFPVEEDLRWRWSRPSAFETRLARGRITALFFTASDPMGE